MIEGGEGYIECCGAPFVRSHYYRLIMVMMKLARWCGPAQHLSTYQERVGYVLISDISTVHFMY